jgi:chorismate mutase/prephenate dehydrogenase
LCDITSLKTKPLEAMLQGYAGPVVGLHPLFGPSTNNMDQQIVVVSPGRDASSCAWVLDQFSVWGNVMVETPPEAHDEAMSIVQALRHFATFAFGRFLCARKVPIARTLELSAPIYRLEMGMVGRLFAQNPALYAEIVFATPERQALLKEFVQSMSQNLEMIEHGDKEEFIHQFRQIADWFGPFGEQAMRETTFLIDKLVHRI